MNPNYDKWPKNDASKKIMNYKITGPMGILGENQDINGHQGAICLRFSLYVKWVNFPFKWKKFLGIGFTKKKLSSILNDIFFYSQIWSRFFSSFVL